MDGESPNLQISTPNAGNVANTDSPSLLDSSDSLPSMTMLPYPPFPTDTTLSKSGRTDQANVIVALSILGVLAIMCIIASFVLTSRSMLGERMSAGLQSMAFYPYEERGSDIGQPRERGKRRKKLTRIPKLWDVEVAAVDEKEPDDENEECWQNMKPLSADLIYSRKPSREFPRALENRSTRVNVNVLIAMPHPRPSNASCVHSGSTGGPSSRPHHSATTEYAIGTTTVLTASLRPMSPTTPDGLMWLVFPDKGVQIRRRGPDS